jgi:hypothetical protein
MSQAKLVSLLETAVVEKAGALDAEGYEANLAYLKAGAKVAVETLESNGYIVHEPAAEEGTVVVVIGAAESPLVSTQLWAEVNN